MKNQYILVLALMVVALGGFLFYSTNNDRHMGAESEHHGDERVAAHEIYPSDVVDKVREGEDVVLLDVRTLEEYEEIHLENALLLPVQEMSAQTLDSIGLGADAKDKEIIIYCRSGGRGKTAYDIMSSLGYTNIKSVSGGMIHWQEDQYPLTETGAYTGPQITTENNTEVLTEGPTIAFNRTLHDFGVIPQYGGTVETTFTVTNEGIENLEIGTITTSCSCTSAEISSSSIEPGGKAVLTVVFDPDFHEEPLDVFKRTVFIPTNDPQTPEAEVAIQVDITEGQ